MGNSEENKVPAGFGKMEATVQSVILSGGFESAVGSRLRRRNEWEGSTLQNAREVV